MLDKLALILTIIGGINWVQSVKDSPDIAKLVEKGKSAFTGFQPGQVQNQAGMGFPLVQPQGDRGIGVDILDLMAPVDLHLVNMGSHGLDTAKNLAANLLNANMYMAEVGDGILSGYLL